jgi:hypothetical protein
MYYLNPNIQDLYFLQMRSVLSNLGWNIELISEVDLPFSTIWNGLLKKLFLRVHGILETMLDFVLNVVVIAL